MRNDEIKDDGIENNCLFRRRVEIDTSYARILVQPNFQPRTRRQQQLDFAGENGVSHV